MNTQYTPEYFIKKFEAIPEEQWFIGDFTDQTGTRHCALGHCGYIAECDGLETVTIEGRSLIKLFDTGLTPPTQVSAVNDGIDNLYQQPTPKQRILAALRDIAEMEKK